MRRVTYAASLSLDGYIDAARGDPDWMFPDEELHRHFNELEAAIDMHLYGRRMYELMTAYWSTADEQPSAPPWEVEYAGIWKRVAKVVFSKTLDRVDWNARLVVGDAAAEVARLKAQPGKAMSVGGAALAASLADAGLIDEYWLYYVPVILGGGDSPTFLRQSCGLVAAALADSRIVVLPGQRHIAMDTAPELFVREALAFLLG